MDCQGRDATLLLGVPIYIERKCIYFTDVTGLSNMERRPKIRYDITDAVNYVLEPGSDSELSELEDDDDEDFEPEDEKMNKILKQEEYESEDLDLEDNTETEQNAKSSTSFQVVESAIIEDSGDEDDTKVVSKEKEHAKSANEAKHQTEKSHTFRWRNRKPPAVDSTFTGEDFSLPPENFQELTPLWYFKLFWDDDMTNQLAEQTNLYSVQKTGASVVTTKEEIEMLLGMQMRMGVVKMPRYDNYWQAETRYGPIADVMSKNRYKKLRKFLHANDNSLKHHSDKKANKMFKVSPIWDKLRENCQQLE
ncbi:MAG: hypothetical protein GY817_03580 [bacterium]|nr:hypothetical protein [bacterium]